MRSVQRLVVLGDSLTALGVARDGMRRGLEVHLVAADQGIATHTRMARVHRVGDARDDEATARLLCELARAAPSALIATSDGWLRFLMRRRVEVDAAFHSVLHPDNAILTICLDKARFAAWCAEHGLSAPRAVAGFDAAPVRALGFPLLVRPTATRHEGGMGDVPKAIEVRGSRELEALRAEFVAAGASAIISESLLGEGLVQYSVGCARSPRGMLSFVAEKVRPSPATCAVGTYVVLRPFEPAERLARAALDAMGYYGIAEVEVMYSGGRNQCFLIEVNARPWLQYGMVRASGRDFLAFLLDEDRRPGRTPQNVGVRWINAASDLHARLFGSGRGGPPGHPGLLDYALSVLRANSYSTFAWRDLGPVLQSMQALLARVWTRRWGRGADRPSPRPGGPGPSGR